MDFPAPSPHVRCVQELKQFFLVNPCCLFLIPADRESAQIVSRLRSKRPAQHAMDIGRCRETVSRFLRNPVLPSSVFRELLALSPGSGGLETFLREQVHQCLRHLPAELGHTNGPLEVYVTTETVSDWLISKLLSSQHDHPDQKL